MLHVLILAAGLGTRLRPLTDSIPKPLVSVVDASILEHQVRFVGSLGEVALHINAHYLAPQIESFAKELGFFKVWHEEELLGTGGPIHRISKELEIDELLVLNGDCYCSLDLKAFLEAARNSSAPVALLSRDFPSVNTLLLRDSKLCGIAERFSYAKETARATFSGISWYNKKALKEIQESERDVRDFWRRLIEQGNAPAVIPCSQDSLWIDMGTPEGLFSAVKARLKELNKKFWVEDPNLKIDSSITIGENVVIHKGVSLPSPCYLENAVLYQGAETSEKIQNIILGKSFSWGVK